MATLVGLTNYQFGVASAETSFEIKSLTAALAPEFKTFAMDRSGSKKGFAVGPTEIKVSVSGDVSATSSGWWAWTFTSAITVANTYEYLGATAGGLYLDSLNVVEGSDAFKTISAELSQNQGIA